MADEGDNNSTTGASIFKTRDVEGRTSMKNKSTYPPLSIGGNQGTHRSRHGSHAAVPNSLCRNSRLSC
jgi:hypothetical protein